MGLVEIQRDDVRPVAYLDSAAVGSALNFSTVEGGHFDRIIGLHYGWILIVAVVYYGAKVQLLQHIQVVVAGCAVGAEADVEPLLQHMLHPGKAASELKVAGRAVYGRHATFLHQRYILIRYPYAVGGKGGAVKRAEIMEPLGGGPAVFFYAGIVLGLCLGQVYMHYGAQLFTFFAVAADYVLKTGVLRVYGQVYLYPAVCRVVVAIVKRKGFLYPVTVLIGLIGIKCGEGAAEVGLHARLYDAVRRGVAEVIHIRKADGAG